MVSVDGCVNYGTERSCVNGVVWTLEKLLSDAREYLPRSGLRPSIVFLVIISRFRDGRKGGIQGL